VAYDRLTRTQRDVLLVAAALGDNWSPRPALAIVDTLLAHGANPDARTDGYHTYPLPRGVPCLHAVLLSFAFPDGTPEGTAAIARKRNAALEAAAIALVRAGASPAPRRGKVTALHDAAEHGALDLLRVLVKQGARVDARDRWGLTPLVYAAREDEAAALRALLAAGATNVRLAARETPYDHAVAAGAARCAAILARRFGAGRHGPPPPDVARVLARLARDRHSLVAPSGKPDPMIEPLIASGRLVKTRIHVRLRAYKLPRLAPRVRRELLRALGHEVMRWLAAHGVATSGYSVGSAEPWFHARGRTSAAHAAKLFAR
jgi:hypothetical protein